MTNVLKDFPEEIRRKPLPPIALKGDLPILKQQLSQLLKKDFRLYDLGANDPYTIIKAPSSTSKGFLPSHSQIRHNFKRCAVVALLVTPQRMVHKDFISWFDFLR